MCTPLHLGSYCLHSHPLPLQMSDCSVYEPLTLQSQVVNEGVLGNVPEHDINGMEQGVESMLVSAGIN